MKRIVALALFAVLGLAVAGCGSGKKARIGQYTVTLFKKSGAITVTGTTTISNVTTGTLVRCKGGPAVKVPRRGYGAAASSAETAVTIDSTTTGPTSTGEIRLTHHQNGSVTVSCAAAK